MKFRKSSEKGGGSKQSRLEPVTITSIIRLLIVSNEGEVHVIIMITITVIIIVFNEEGVIIWIVMMITISISIIILIFIMSAYNRLH